MGLDIYAYRDASFVMQTTEDDYDWEIHSDNRWFKACVRPDYIQHAGPLKHNSVYKAQEATRFDIGSCTYYNNWREELRKILTRYGIINYAAESCPFSELIHFSDCEGTIGPELCQKLYNDFVSHRDYLFTVFTPKQRVTYIQLMRAFETGSQHGAVDFR